jgi:hypothetical protein
MRKVPSTKFQVPKKFQKPISKLEAHVLELDAWSLFGTWNLGFGISF